MRDKNRIEPFLQELGEYWKKVPDWRFGQLIVNVFSTLNRDPFFYEDAEMIDEFRKYFSEKK